MVTVDIQEAKTQLSKLVDKAVKGETFVIAKAGMPLVKVTAIDAPAEAQRLGFMAGEIEVPDDFDRMGAADNVGWVSPIGRNPTGRDVTSEDVGLRCANPTYNSDVNRAD